VLRVEGQHRARRMWRVFEPVHAVTYFAPEVAEAFGACGLKGFWMGYFAGRAAPLGPVEPAVVEATFYNFAPARVRRAIPDAWRFADRHRVLDARVQATVGALRRLLPDTEEAAARAAGLARRVVESLDLDGRPLAAANAELPLPDEPMAALWQLCTVLREHRGDGHVAALVDAELDGCESHVTVAGAGTVPRQVLQGARGWSDEDWEAAAERLRQRGLLDADGVLTEAGRALRASVEATTDRLARRPWEQLGSELTEELHGLLEPMAQALHRAGALPVVNPMGLPAPASGR
jgi:hypothetical protein